MENRGRLEVLALIGANAVGKGEETIDGLAFVFISMGITDELDELDDEPV